MNGDVRYFPGCQICGEYAAVLLISGCLDQHCFEYAYCPECASRIIGSGNYACPECRLKIEEKYWMGIPKGHVPIGRFH